MKTYSIKILLLSLSLLQIFAFAKEASQLESLYQNRQYFELRDELAKLKNDKSPDVLFYRAAFSRNRSYHRKCQ